MINVEYDIINFSPIGQNINSYPKEDNNSGDDSSMVLMCESHVCDTIITDNTDLGSNNIPESMDLVLSFLHISGAKYRMYSRKKKLPQILTSTK